MNFDIDRFRYDRLITDPLVRDIWHTKYRLVNPDGSSDEETVEDTRSRIVEAVYAYDLSSQARNEAMHFVQEGILIPAGRINAGAGTDRVVTLVNCFVLPIVQDCMPGIQEVIMQGALTMQQGGGVGVDFSPIRPAGALVKRTGSVASGIIPFADQMDAMGKTIMSAGTRRAAMMLCLRDDHPDLWNERQFEMHLHPATGEPTLTHPSFISAKRQKGRLTGFNVSITVSDRFMQAVKRDEMWDLGFHVPPADGQYIEVYTRPFPYDEVNVTNGFLRTPGRAKGDPAPWYVYRRAPARRIWDDIMHSTYKYAEPGVLFIDTINKMNNLNYCEEIYATNPCAEQVLPPNGDCCLASLNLAFLVNNSFNLLAAFDWSRFREAVHCGVRFLDNVLDVTGYPLQQQHEEALAKRRIGLGITGFADALLQLGIRYGSDASVDIARQIGKCLHEESYRASVSLARERGSFPKFDAEEFTKSPNIRNLPVDLQADIADYGIRNGVLNTIAPNGTISIYSGNVASGHEPYFAFDKVIRTVRQPDGSGKQYESTPYSYALWEAIHGPTSREALPEHFVGAMDIRVEDHLRVHAAWQEYIDSSISKTINCPTDMPFEDFQQVYTKAYRLGCKGCTTYRFDPESGRGAVLQLAKDKPAPLQSGAKLFTGGEGEPAIMPAQRVVEARRYKLKWPPNGENWYITITRYDGHPFEVFVTSNAAAHSEWVQALSRLLTAVLRRGGDVTFLIKDLQEVHSALGGAFIPEQHAYRTSVIAAIGGILEEEFRTLGLIGSSAPAVPVSSHVVPVTVISAPGTADACPHCGATPLVHEQGCVRCLQCDFTKCG